MSHDRWPNRLATITIVGWVVYNVVFHPSDWRARITFGFDIPAHVHAIVNPWFHPDEPKPDLWAIFNPRCATAAERAEYGMPEPTQGPCVARRTSR